MEVTVKIKLASGKEVELTLEEINEIVYKFQKTKPYVVDPFFPYTGTWTSTGPCAATTSGYAHRVDN
jgi:hypothetical protein